MAISGDGETQTLVQSPLPFSSSSSELRHRRGTFSSSSAAAASFPVSGASDVDSSGQTGLDSSSESDSWRHADEGDHRVDEPEEAKAEASNDKEFVERSEGQGAKGSLPDKFFYRASAPAHRKIKESPLSSDAIFKQSHAGLFNLCIVVLIAVNGRLIIENLMKYGLLIRAGFWFSSKSLRDWPLLMCCLSLPLFLLGAFLIEKLAWRKYIYEPRVLGMSVDICGTVILNIKIVIALHVMLTTLAILYPVYVILWCDSAVLSGFTLMFAASIFWLKLVSYAHTNYDIRALARSFDMDDTSSNFSALGIEEGVSFKQLVYFMVAPTLCYQQSYPQTACIRKGWVVRQVIKLVTCTGLMGFIVEQYINPIVKNSQHPLKGNLLYAIERVLKLSVPTLYVWLCMFYCFFHLWLNILAELLCFGDREFYKDWWNAETVEEYWRMWNMPVHKWMVRHIYFPCLRNGIPKGVAILVSFFVSAIFHELCVGVPCHIFKFWAFLGILLQIPLLILTRYIQNKFRSTMVGNMIFWFFFSIFGQPMCILLYYHDVMNRKARID